MTKDTNTGDCNSGRYNSGYYNSGPYVGLFQHLNSNGEYDDDPWYEPWWNIALAAEKFATSGYSPWSGTDW